MQMPTISEHHKKMTALEGTWAGDDTLMPSPWLPAGGQAAGTITARAALGGFHLIVDWTQERDGKLNFEGHGVLGWDPRGKCYTMHWFDCMGVEHAAPLLGTWEGNTLTLTHETSHMGHSRQVYVFGEDDFQFKLEQSQDGRVWNTFMEGIYRRRR